MEQSLIKQLKIESIGTMNKTKISHSSLTKAITILHKTKSKLSKQINDYCANPKKFAHSHKGQQLIASQIDAKRFLEKQRLLSRIRQEHSANL